MFFTYIHVPWSKLVQFGPIYIIRWSSSVGLTKDFGGSDLGRVGSRALPQGVVRELRCSGS